MPCVLSISIFKINIDPIFHAIARNGNTSNSLLVNITKLHLQAEKLEGRHECLFLITAKCPHALLPKSGNYKSEQIH